MSSSTLIHWRDWSEETFRDARAEDKPILLDIGAVWCHWCHVMDTGIPGDPVHTGTYSNPRIAEIVNNRFIPIKVDNDRRPDINSRYNMGGWPTTAFLTPAGEPLYGETYITPDRMIGLLNHIADYYATQKTEIAAKLAAYTAEEAQAERSRGLLTAEIIDHIVGQLKANFDFAFGGFGTQPKFPHPYALAFAIQQYASTRDEELRLIVEKTLESMAGGGTYDKYAGGFFRYSTTRDWSIPHYEKMLEDNALLSRVCLLAAKAFGEPKSTALGEIEDVLTLREEGLHKAGGWGEVARDVHAWLLETMFDPATSTFAGSQDADKEDAYYGLPLDQRAGLPTPYIDRTVYLDWNALTVSSLVERYRQDQEEPILAIAKSTYAFLSDRIWPHHFFDDGMPQGEQYLLDDVCAMIDAAIDLMEATGDSSYLSDARRYAAALLTRLYDPVDGGFRDLQPLPNAIGALAKPKKEIDGAAKAALALLHLYAATDDSSYRQAAESGLRLFADDIGRYGFFASSYALAVAVALTTPTRVVIVGDPTPETRALRAAAWRALPPFSGIVETLSPSSSGEYPPSPSGAPLAYICIGTNCRVASSVAELVSILKRGDNAPE